jgi:hypothetical protein
MLLQKRSQGGGCPLLGLDAWEQRAQSPKCQIGIERCAGNASDVGPFGERLDIGPIGCDHNATDHV